MFIRNRPWCNIQLTFGKCGCINWCSRPYPANILYNFALPFLFLFLAHKALWIIASISLEQILSWLSGAAQNLRPSMLVYLRKKLYHAVVSIWSRGIATCITVVMSSSVNCLIWSNTILVFFLLLYWISPYLYKHIFIRSKRWLLETFHGTIHLPWSS